MTFWDFIGLLSGLAGGFLGIYFALRALGFGEYLGGKHAKPWAVPKDELYGRPLALNSENLPYEVKPDPSGRCDLVLEWKLADARWYGIFSKNRFGRWYKVYMLLDEARKSVRYLEETGSITWRAGTKGLMPIINVNYSRSLFRGKKPLRQGIFQRIRDKRGI